MDPHLPRDFNPAFRARVAGRLLRRIQPRHPQDSLLLTGTAGLPAGASSMGAGLSAWGVGALPGASGLLGD